MAHGALLGTEKGSRDMSGELLVGNGNKIGDLEYKKILQQIQALGRARYRHIDLIDMCIETLAKLAVLQGLAATCPTITKVSYKKIASFNLRQG